MTTRSINILKSRAEKLAKILEKEKAAVPTLEGVIFRLGQEKYAIETKFVKEVYPFKDFTILPNAPQFIFGLVNIRRKILSIFNLKVFFGLEEKKTENSDMKLIILENDAMEIAILIDEIFGIQLIPQDHLQSSIPTLTGTKQEFLKGVTSDRIILLDGDKLLASKQIIVDENVEI